MNSSYDVGQHVDATVEQVLPFGVFVRLADDTQAYIRRRELSLDPDTPPATVVTEGETLSAAVLSLPEAGKHMELSRRATLPDPWPDFAHRFHVGDTVQGKVTRLSSIGVFVRLAPGVSGFVPLTELAPWPVEKPEDLLWVGDEIQATITRLEPDIKRLRLSIRAYLKSRETATAIVEKLVAKNEASLAEQPVGAPEPDPSSPATPEDRQRVGYILVVDDHAEFRAPLVNWLVQRGYCVVEAQDMTEALRRVEQQPCQILLTDLNLPDGDGLELAQQLRRNARPPWICLMSSPDWLAERSAEVEAAQVTHVFVKPVDIEEIDAFLLQVAYSSDALPRWQVTRHFTSLPDFGSAVETTKLPRAGRLQAALQKMTELLNAEKGILFAMEPDSQAISILAQTGSLPLQTEVLYELADSPVKDVIREMTPAFERNFSAQAGGRFRKLANLLPFETCLGVPVEVQGEVRHAAFFFHRRPRAFSDHHLRDALAGAVLLSGVLEFQQFDEYMRSSSALLLSGEIALGFSHEVYNKVSGLELMLRNLQSNANSLEEQRLSLASMGNLIQDMKTIAETFQRITHSGAKREVLDVNEIVQRADLLLRPLARKERVTVALHLAPSLPPIFGHSAWLQQIFLNLMLNAVQQMALKADKHRLLEIKTISARDQSRVVQVRFTDTGPGIHKQYWEQVFALGFTTRPGGTGLGLFLVRSLLEGMGGIVKVEESFIPCGTTFVIELPVLETTEAK